MRNAVVGIVIGCVLGIMLGATVIAPQMDAARTGQAPLPAGSETLDAAPRPLSQASSSAQTQSVVLRLASAFSLQSPDLGAQITDFATQSQRSSDDMLRISLQEPNAPITPQDFYDAISSGALDGAFIDPGLWADRAPGLRFFSALPFGPKMAEFLAWYTSGGGREAFEKIAKTLSVHALACGIAPGEAAGWYRNPITSATSFQHLRIAAKGLEARVLTRVGAKVFDMKTPDIFMAMEEGLLDGAQLSRPTVDSRLKLNQLASTYYFPGWHKPMTLLALMIGEKTWDSLPSPYQAQIELACSNALRRGLGMGETVQFAALKRMTAEGVNIRRIPQSALNALKKAWDATAREEAGKDKNFALLWQSLQKFRKNYAIWREMSTP